MGGCRARCLGSTGWPAGVGPVFLTQLSVESRVSENRCWLAGEWAQGQGFPRAGASLPWVGLRPLESWG